MPPARSALPAPIDLAALAEKYRELARLRHDRAAGGDVAPRDLLRALATRFPGALRELELLPSTVIAARIEELDRTIAAGGAAEPWMRAVAEWHTYWRAELSARRRERNAKQPRGALRTRALTLVATSLGVSNAELASLLWPKS